ncbi:FAD dependent oxidoreductase [Mycena metata]|uniref:FAD dependent oxidoreductase n=1 Tax=Mycena metata TaxID=1033252 RepID=A0AAD7K7C9_9AGAR|nr:FAD dependent oxidoreductase [Mycena metata]
MATLRKIYAVFALASVFPLALALKVCTQIQHAVSFASAVYYPDSANYTADIAHWTASSTQSAACSVEPGTAADVSIIIRLLGETKTPFAVKGGGHDTNPGFSSTTGVQIAMTRFSTVNYDEQSGTVAIGPGMIWDDVYAELAQYGVIVTGGRVSGVGVAGFTLGGGFNWLANQVGLAVDTVVGYELVKPNGDIVSVTASDTDLFFALKGGFNNFGIVTQFIFKAFPIGQVWGGFIVYGAAQLPAFTAALANFAANSTDPKGQLISAYSNNASGEPMVSNLMFYDGPSPPPGVFDEFLAIQNQTASLSTRSFLSLFLAAPQILPAGTRGYFDTLSFFQYTPAIVDAILNETTFWGARLAPIGASIQFHLEPFLESIYTHNTSPTAFPSFRAPRVVPLQVEITWTDPQHDVTIQEALKQSGEHLTNVAVQDGQAIQQAPLYPNYALFTHPIERIYGSNLPRLRAIKAKVDPDNVMGLAGGWKI